MNNNDILNRLHDWFRSYICSFDRSEADVQRNFDLKEQHSYRVLAEMRDIAASLKMNGDDTTMAEIMALFHDVGRFEQYRRYRTFMDPISEDHGDIGVRVLRELRPLAILSERCEGMVIAAVGAHNKRHIPSELTSECRHYTMMLRDADKLDIWKIALEYYQSASTDPAVKLNLPEDPVVTPKVFRDLMDGKVADKNDLRTLCDFQLCQTAWVYDLNFSWSLRAVRERGYLQQAQPFMANLPEIRTIYGRSQAYLYGQ